MDEEEIFNSYQLGHGLERVRDTDDSHIRKELVDCKLSIDSCSNLDQYSVWQWWELNPSFASAWAYLIDMQMDYGLIE